MPDTHPPEDRCFFCATDDEMVRALDGEEPRTIHMQIPEEGCPSWCGCEVVEDEATPNSELAVGQPAEAGDPR